MMHGTTSLKSTVWYSPRPNNERKFQIVLQIQQTTRQQVTSVPRDCDEIM